MAFPYQHILMVGATSGIGKAMADRLLEGGPRSRRLGEERTGWREFVSRYGKSKAVPVSFDIANTEQIPSFAAEVMRMSPDINCIYLNVGIQHRYDFSQPETVDLAKSNSELNINFTSFVALTHAFLPFLTGRETETSLVL
ncbi:hypothetical protein MMC13_001592 [Lambiella insularis]|nr:hypothetical protein [Lambiella insularis]